MLHRSRQYVFFLIRASLKGHELVSRSHTGSRGESRCKILCVCLRLSQQLLRLRRSPRGFGRIGGVQLSFDTRHTFTQYKLFRLVLTPYAVVVAHVVEELGPLTGTHVYRVHVFHRLVDIELSRLLVDSKQGTVVLLVQRLHGTT